jgi:hypothetical protein
MTFVKVLIPFIGVGMGGKVRLQTRKLRCLGRAFQLFSGVRKVYAAAVSTVSILMVVPVK